MPGLLGEETQEPVSQVAVAAEDVGEGVVLVVVRVPPGGGRAGIVPVVGLRVELRVLHPVVLAMHHVVAEFHVLEDLGAAEQERAQYPGRRQNAGEEQRAAAELGPAYCITDATHVACVVLAESGEDAVAQLVQLRAEGGGLLAGERSTEGWRHAICLHRYECIQRSRVTSDTGTEMHRRMSSSGSAVIAPLSRFFTAPLCLRQVQLWQMPMRHPLRGLSPAVSACTSKGTPVSPRTSVNERAKRRTISGVRVALITAGVKASPRGDSG